MINNYCHLLSNHLFTTDFVCVCLYQKMPPLLSKMLDQVAASTPVHAQDPKPHFSRVKYYQGADILKQQP